MLALSLTLRHERSHVVELLLETGHLTWAAFTGQAHPHLRLPPGEALAKPFSATLACS